MPGDALTKDKADAADLLRACARASACQLADESSTLQRAREEREAPIFHESQKVKFEVTGDERLTRTFLEGLTDVVPTESSTTAAHECMRVSFSVVRPSVETRESKSDAALVPL